MRRDVLRFCHSEHFDKTYFLSRDWFEICRDIILSSRLSSRNGQVRPNVSKPHPYGTAFGQRMNSEHQLFILPGISPYSQTTHFLPPIES